MASGGGGFYVVLQYLGSLEYIRFISDLLRVGCALQRIIFKYIMGKLILKTSLSQLDCQTLGPFAETY